MQRVRKAIDNANASAAAYSDLQGFIRDQLTTKFSRSDRSVSCTPHVDQVLPGDMAALAAFEGPRDGIDFSQLVPGVIQRLTELITSKGKVRLGSISRFVLTNSMPGGNSGWTIYLTSGSTRFRALVLGNDPQIITPSGTHDLN
jgi:hypothetical protein